MELWVLLERSGLSVSPCRNAEFIKLACDACDHMDWHGRSSLAIVSVNQNLEPPPGALSTPTCPPRCPIMVLQICSPTPSPMPDPLWTSIPRNTMEALPHLFLLRKGF